MRTRAAIATVIELLMLAICNSCGGGGGSNGSPPESTGASKVEVRWHTVPGVAGYVVHWGGASRDYTGALDVGSPAPAADESLAIAVEVGPPGVYYFAVTCYDDARYESAYSNEISLGVP